MNTENNKLTILVAGASGATGRLLVDQLLQRGHDVRAIVRTPENLPDFLKNRERLTIIKASILDLKNEEMIEYVRGCDAIASCLGHNISWKGIYGHPRRLVTDAVRRLSEAARKTQSEKALKFVLMNTTGNRNRDLNEPISLAQKCILGLLRLMLPPHVDNEQAADYLRTQIGQDHTAIEWVAVRPDGLINKEQISEYDIYPSPIRSAIFDAGQTSRINVGHFMADLITNNSTWEKWKGQMPVIYNR